MKKEWMFSEERIKAKETISKLNLKEKLALFDELNSNIKESNEYLSSDVEKEEWNKMIERRKELNERK